MLKTFWDKICSLFNTTLPLWLVSYPYYLRSQFIKRAITESDIKGKKLIDIGADDAHNKKLFKNLEYTSLDFKPHKNKIDIIADIDKGLPMIEDESYDYILCIQVLEHLKKPHQAYQEFYRILRHGGKLFLTTNFCYEEHLEPHDYFRFTQYGLEYLGKTSQLVPLKIKAQGGIFHLIALIINTLIIKLFLKRDSQLYYLYLILFSPLIILVNLVCTILDLLDRKKIMTINYECIYEKK